MPCHGHLSTRRETTKAKLDGEGPSHTENWIDIGFNADFAKRSTSLDNHRESWTSRLLKGSRSLRAGFYRSSVLENARLGLEGAVSLLRFGVYAGKEKKLWQNLRETVQKD